MNKLTNVQIINDNAGLPAFAVIPYSEYLHLADKKNIITGSYIPSEVVNLVFGDNYTTIKAWRMYLKISQNEMANRLGVTQSAYSQYESTEKLRKATRIKIANALGIKEEQLDF